MSQTFAKNKAVHRHVLSAAAVALAVLFAGAAPVQAADRPGLSFSKSVKAQGGSGKDITFQAPQAGTVTVSDRDFNRFIFPASVKKLVMPAGTPILGEPIYMAENTVVLIQFQRGADKSVQFIAETEEGGVHSVRVLPRPVDGVVHRIDGAREASRTRARALQAGDLKSTSAESPRGELIEVLKRVVVGDVPEDFESVALPDPMRFDKFSVVPLAGWSDGMALRVMAFSLVAAEGQTAVVAAPQFYRPGIAAVLVDGDVVDAHNSPTLYVVEEVSDE